MQCKHTKENGEQCQANAMTDSNFCYLHNPDISEEAKREAQARGGESKLVRVKKPLPQLKISKNGDVVYLLVDTITRVRNGEMDIKVANCLGFLSDKLIRALEVGDLETRLEKLEERVGDKLERL